MLAHGTDETGLARGDIGEVVAVGTAPARRLPQRRAERQRHTVLDEPHAGADRDPRGIVSDQGLEIAVDHAIETRAIAHGLGAAGRCLVRCRLAARREQRAGEADDDQASPDYRQQSLQPFFDLYGSEIPHRLECKRLHTCNPPFRIQRAGGGLRGTLARTNLREVVRDLIRIVEPRRHQPRQRFAERLFHRNRPLLRQRPDRIDRLDDVLDAGELPVGRLRSRRRPDADRRRAVPEGILRDAEHRVLHGRQFLETDERAVERAALLEIVGGDADLETAVRFLRRVGRDDELDPLTVRIGDERAARAADGLEDRRRKSVVREPLRQRRFVSKPHRPEAHAGGIVDRAARELGVRARLA